MPRPRCNVRDAWAERFNLHYEKHISHVLTDPYIRQLSLCKSDEARRLLLGISEQEGHDEK